MRYLSVLFCLLWVSCTANLLAQMSFFPELDSTYRRYGLFGATSRVEHNARFTRLPGFATNTCCPSSEYGAAVANLFLNVGIMADIPVTSLFFGSFRLGIYSHNADLRSVRLTTVAEVQGTVPTIANSETIEESYLLTPRLTLLALSPMVGIRPLKPLSITAGLQLGTYIQKSFSIRTQLPDATVYSDNTAAKDVFVNQTIPDINPFQAALTAGISYEFPVNRKGTILPALEAFYSYSLTNVVKALPWRIHSFRGGLSIRLSPYRTTELSGKEVEEILQDSLRRSMVLVDSALALKNRSDSLAREARKNTLSARITTIEGVMPDGALVAQPTLRVEKVPVSDKNMILPFLFFSEGSAVLPSRYKRILPAHRTTFNPDSAARTDKLGTYYQILNIIGKRLQDNPQAAITLVGYTTNTGLEKTNRNLARQRAESIAGYLQEVWRISTERMTIQEQSAPEGIIPSDNSPEADEYLRVEIRANPTILTPVSFDYTKRIAMPPVIRFGFDVTAGAGLKQWNFDIAQFYDREEHPLFSHEGKTAVPATFDWNVNERAIFVPQYAEPLEVKLSITDITNRNLDAQPVSLPVEQRDAPYRLHTALIFIPSTSPGQSARLQQDPQIQRTLETLSTIVTPSSQITLTGYGLPSEMSIITERQRLVSQLLQRLKVPITPANRAPLYDTALPEGRMYNRVIQIDVRTPR